VPVPAAGTTLRFGCGSTYVDPTGATWSALAASVGAVSTTSNAISGAGVLTSVYQHQCYGNPMNVVQALVNGVYTVTLYSAETYWCATWPGNA
jgi:hypothetical protein